MIGNQFSLFHPPDFPFPISVFKRRIAVANFHQVVRKPVDRVAVSLPGLQAAFKNRLIIPREEKGGAHILIRPADKGKLFVHLCFQLRLIVEKSISRKASRVRRFSGGKLPNEPDKGETDSRHFFSNPKLLSMAAGRFLIVNHRWKNFLSSAREVLPAALGEEGGKPKSNERKSTSFKAMNILKGLG
jgi:hypothetical protein